jgi:hypothetical protein
VGRGGIENIGGHQENIIGRYGLVHNFVRASTRVVGLRTTVRYAGAQEFEKQ